MPAAATQHTVLIIGAGAAGIAVDSSLLARDRSLDIALVDPAEVHYGGKLAPSFPRWLLDGRKATRLAWWLKAWVLPPLYWRGMLKGREWLAKPTQEVRS